jgi:hypothetical protein
LLLWSACDPSELQWGHDSAGGGLLCVFDTALCLKVFASLKQCRGEGYSRVTAATAARGYRRRAGLGTIGYCQAGLAWMVRRLEAVSAPVCRVCREGVM